MGFTEVSGLDFEIEVIEYRQGTEKEYTKSKQPGLIKYSDVILKEVCFMVTWTFISGGKKSILKTINET
jgi:phage tail-like protein